MGIGEFKVQKTLSLLERNYNLGIVGKAFRVCVRGRKYTYTHTHAHSTPITQMTEGEKIIKSLSHG